MSPEAVIILKIGRVTIQAYIRCVTDTFTAEFWMQLLESVFSLGVVYVLEK